MSRLITQDGIDPVIKHFDVMPDTARVDVNVVAAIFGCSAATVQRMVRLGKFPKPEKIGTASRWTVRAVRSHVMPAQ